MRNPQIIVAALALTLVTACGSSSSSSSSQSSSPSTAAVGSSAGAVVGPTTPSPAAPASGVGTIPQADRSPAGTPGSKPTVTVPGGPPPQALESADLIPGSGAAAKNGDTLTMQYVGMSYTLRKQFDASWDRGQPFQFQLGAGMVIPGWDQGLVGMKVGGRRELIIPPSLGYGSQSPSPDIPANDTLIFVVDLVKIG